MANTSAAGCTFCDLIAGAAEVSVCYEDATAIAFMDIQPVNDGHVLVAPREHYESLVDLPPELGLHLYEVAMRLAPVVRKVAGTDALNIVVNSGEAAGQDVFHYHVHVIPRRRKDGLRGFFWPRTKYASDEEAAAVARKIERLALTRA